MEPSLSHFFVVPQLRNVVCIVLSQIGSAFNLSIFVEKRKIPEVLFVSAVACTEVSGLDERGCKNQHEAKLQVVCHSDSFKAQSSERHNNLPSLLALGSLFSILVYYMCSTGGQIIGQHFSRIYGFTANVDNKDTIFMPFTFQNHIFEYYGLSHKNIDSY